MFNTLLDTLKLDERKLECRNLTERKSEFLLTRGNCRRFINAITDTYFI